MAIIPSTELTPDIRMVMFSPNDSIDLSLKTKLIERSVGMKDVCDILESLVVVGYMDGRVGEYLKVEVVEINQSSVLPREDRGSGGDYE